MSGDRQYFETRRREELKRALKAKDDAIARLHCEMANEYARRLRDDPALQPETYIEGKPDSRVQD